MPCDVVVLSLRKGVEPMNTKSKVIVIDCYKNSDKKLKSWCICQSQYKFRGPAQFI